MSWWNPIDDLKSVGSGIKNAAVGVGHAVGKVASNPVVEGLGGMALGSGVGTLLGAGGGALKEGGGLKGAVKGAGQGYLAGVAGQAAGGALGAAITGAPAIGPALASFAATHGVDAAKALLSKVPGLGAASDFLTGNGGQNALTAAQAVNATLLGKKSSDYANNAMGSTQANWDERAPLRTAGQAGLLNPGAGIAPKIAALPNRNLYSAPSGPPTLGPARIGP